MKINEEIRKSIIEETRKNTGITLSDEELDEISGGRKLYWQENDSICQQIEEYNGKLPYRKFENAMYRYINHIRSLEEGSEIELFDYEKYKVD